MRTFKYTVKFSGQYTGANFETKEQARKHAKESNDKTFGYGFVVYEIAGATKREMDFIQKQD